MIFVCQMHIQAASVHWRMQLVARLDFRHVRWLSRFKDTPGIIYGYRHFSMQSIILSRTIKQR